MSLLLATPPSGKCFELSAQNIILANTYQHQDTKTNKSRIKDSLKKTHKNMEMHPEMHVHTIISMIFYLPTLRYKPLKSNLKEQKMEAIYIVLHNYFNASFFSEYWIKVERYSSEFKSTDYSCKEPGISSYHAYGDCNPRFRFSDVLLYPPQLLYTRGAQNLIQVYSH